jgi:hypothetical protein
MNHFKTIFLFSLFCNFSHPDLVAQKKLHPEIHPKINYKSIRYFHDPIDKNKCNGSYLISNGLVYFDKRQSMLSSALINQKRIDVDTVSFQVLGHGYAKDTNNIYYEGESISNCDRMSFSVIDIDYSFNPRINEIINYYANDNHTVFYGKNFIENADPVSFRLLSINYSVDKNTVYYKGNPLVGADPTSMKSIKNEFNRMAKDKHHVYYGDKILSDYPNSFRSLDNTDSCIREYFVDEERGYFTTSAYQSISGVTIIDSLNPNKFKIIDCSFATDEKKVFWCGKPIPQADPQSFKGINNDFSLDKNHAYYHDEMIQSADPHTFTVMDKYSPYSKDENNVFHFNLLIQGADPKTFTPLGSLWGKDKNYIYFETTRREDVDYDTFEVTNPVVKDKNYIYDYNGRIIKRNN